jgi:DNA-binding response OmpR family regulator
MEQSQANNAKEILIIEEQAFVSFELQIKLENSGYKVQRAISVSHITTPLNADLVILDAVPTFLLCMQLIDKIWNGITVPIICTSMECTDNLSEVKELKIIGNYFKPFDTTVILKVIDEYFVFPQNDLSVS